jgi:hypothetical protein
VTNPNFFDLACRDSNAQRRPAHANVSRGHIAKILGPWIEIGEKLRAMMPWIKEKALVDKSRN